MRDFSKIMFEKTSFLCRVTSLKINQKKLFFKKKKIPVQKERSYKTPALLSMVGIVFIICLGYVSVRAIDTIEFNIFEFATSSGVTTISWNSGVQDPNIVQAEDLDINENDSTYILITGRWGGNHDAPDLTDTIILVWLNHEQEVITLFSIPRDLWVEYPDSTLSGKINRIYETYVDKDPDIAISKLKEKVTEITGKRVDYHMNLDFQWFIQVVDILGWVEVTLENNFVDYEYPAGPGSYRTFILRKWTWTLDGEVALMYARSRHSTSDFDRSLRQQEIISSLRGKIWNLWYLRNSKTLLDLYWAFKDYVDTDMTVSDMVSLWLKIKKWEDSKTLSFNLNDTCYAGSPNCTAWWFLYVPLREYFGGASVLLPKKSIAIEPGYYDDIQSFATLIYDTPQIYTEAKNIKIYNASGISGLAWSFATQILPYGYDINMTTDLETLRGSGLEKSVIYYNSIEKNDPTLKYLESITKLDIIQIENAQYSNTEVQIEIILVDNNSF